MNQIGLFSVYFWDPALKVAVVRKLKTPYLKVFCAFNHPVWCCFTLCVYHKMIQRTTQETNRKAQDARLRDYLTWMHKH